MAHGDTTLAEMLREELSTLIETETEVLIQATSADHDRMAGRIQAFKEVMSLIGEKYAKINDLRHSQNR